jgi:hypothetical protein
MDPSHWIQVTGSKSLDPSDWDSKWLGIHIQVP